MYYDFFGFKEPPFSIAPDPRYLYLSERHKEALAHLMYGVQGQGGFIVITGEVGTGKTTVSRCFIENAPAHVDIALILNPRLSARELLAAICDELEITNPAGASIKQLVDLINRDLLTAHAAGRHKVLMIDEAQNLSADVLEQLRLLTNLETAEKKLLQIVLLGQPELQQMLALPELRQLNQRVTARYHLDAISPNELPAYLSYRLGVAGMRGDVFSPSAVRKLYRLSNGIPRLINLISDRALLGAYAEGEHELTPAHIRQAAKEVGGSNLGPKPGRAGGKQGFSGYLMLAASLVLAIISTFWLYQQWFGPEAVAESDELVVEQGGTVQRESEPESQVVGNNGDQPGEEQAAGVALPFTEAERLANAAPSELSFEFPEQAQNLAEAFTGLFELWGIDYSPQAFPVACDFARESGLGCLERQGSQRSLMFLDRPAILLLQDDAGNRGYVVLQHLNGRLADITLPTGPVQVPFSSLEPYWFGEYRVLWQLPDHMKSSPVDGEGASEELWIGGRMMELADAHSKSLADNARIKRLSGNEQVRWYQSLKGLTVDGIAGAMTIIQINNDLNADVPRLSATRSGGEE
ncbi:ExeA family protein [Marinobacter sp. 1_MG-2023]|uniref:ExeA family protein n=1 Tax=Marinobacter sp. 1_MG-2023 TaxID=3062627 RepID=UPI0026E38FE7|nr:AAA family ATPase [Marinobacter sp. 1_MG-2023]MDO6824534.1 AAA family ATPase [Marinobacter sp. 1_MG-2023]